MTNGVITLTMMSGPQDGLQTSYPLPQSGQEVALTIGRSEDNDLALPYDSQVSRAHARLVCRYNNETTVGSDEPQRLHLLLVDVGSRNGTYVHDRRLIGERVEIKPGDLFRVGRIWMRVDP